MFDGFTRARVAANGVSINVRHGGSGPPILLLHGYPQTHMMWHKVAPMLAEDYTVVAPDLRGYGDSDKPPAAEGGPERLLQAHDGPGPGGSDDGARMRLVPHRRP